MQIEATSFTLAEADTCCAPGYTAVTLKNRSASEPAFIFVADEAPLHRKLGVYETAAETTPVSPPEPPDRGRCTATPVDA